MKKNEKKDKKENPAAIPPSKTDPNGSYTGRPDDLHEVPVQDADDL